MATNSQVAHAWANQTGKQRNGSNFFYDGDTIYSYGSHFPVARHVDGVVLLTTKRYGNATSKHIVQACLASTHITAYHVPDVLAHSKEGRYSGHRHNVAHYLSEIEANTKKALNARTYGTMYLRTIDDLVKDVKAYAKHFKLGRTFVEKLLLTDEEREKIVAKGVKANAIRDERNKEWMEKFRAEQAAKDESNREHMENWTRWGEDRRFYTTKVYLRASQEKNIVETSHGADVPYRDGELTFRYATARRANGWHRNGLGGYSVGDFNLEEVNDDGIKVGCHNIGWDEIDRLAKVEGWTKD
jgi:hypothetical protein